ncbi:tetraspanin-18 [Lingula anatina]|uniref:Tetraspanin n=1 Tax=Lingula anatina TaxID=7574 RepID=A0A1S3K3D3_LINAN|nr:tetraspanin-18 [Lingula anatina]|eukprot:XP_013417131.1 tetraspanin-18 [Lingula anatina]
MATEGCMSCMKYCMFLFNFIFLIAGLGLSGLGIWLIVDPTLVTSFIPNEDFLQYAGYLLIGLGGFIAIVAFFGCWGAVALSKCMLVMYFLFCLLIFAGLIGGAVMSVLFQDDIKAKLKKEMNATLYTSYGVSKTTTDIWDALQEEVGCCGLSGDEAWLDYQKTAWFARQNGTKVAVPDSCCVEGSDGQILNLAECQKVEATKTDQYIHKKGCFEEGVHKFEAQISQQRWPLFGLAIGTVTILILGMVLSLCLACRSGGKEEKYAM